MPWATKWMKDASGQAPEDAFRRLIDLPPMAPARIGLRAACCTSSIRDRSTISVGLAEDGHPADIADVAAQIAAEVERKNATILPTAIGRRPD